MIDGSKVREEKNNPQLQIYISLDLSRFFQRTLTPGPLFFKQHPKNEKSSTPHTLIRLVCVGFALFHRSTAPGTCRAISNAKRSSADPTVVGGRKGVVSFH